MQYQTSDINIVIPMAGLGSRFSAQGYDLPKPLIDILGKPMIRWVVENLHIDGNYTFIVQQSHIDNYGVDKILNNIKPGCNIVALNGVTDGAARSILYTKHIIDNETPLLIVNSDNLIEWDTDSTIEEFMSGIDGGIITTFADGPKWSYAKVNEDMYVSEVAEKIQISNYATTGHYFWRHGKDFVTYASRMIEKNIRYNNEFYIAPVYNQAIAAGKVVKISQCKKFWSVGTPEDLNTFLAECDISKVK